MSDLIVEVQNLHFSYTIRHASAQSLKQAFINIATGIKSDIFIDAISSINFNLGKGEILAIIGNNGAGKSTLLKLLAGILPPTKGNVRIRGEIAPLIELGAGFNPELTGAENIVLFGVLLGNRRKEMVNNVDSIAEWSGLSDSIHLPLRTYSTGMLSRLGFAVATFRKRELLIIDEVLSVGDLEFQEKSLTRIRELILGGEVTILVSHNIELVKSLATKVLWLEHGRQIMFGEPRDVINAYRKS